MQPKNITKTAKTNRISWDDTFMGLAVLISERTSCKFHKAGVIIVDDKKRILSLGYNGPTEGDDHCIEIGCAKIDGDSEGNLKRCRGIHAEINAIINSQNPIRLKGATIYITIFPCYDCMKAINNSGIKEIVYMEKYKRIKPGGQETEEETEALELANKRNIKIRQHHLENIEIKVNY